jgi:hypothetical protein
MTASKPTTDRLIILRGWWPKTWYSVVSNKCVTKVSGVFESGLVRHKILAAGDWSLAAGQKREARSQRPDTWHLKKNAFSKLLVGHNTE